MRNMINMENMQHGKYMNLILAKMPWSRHDMKYMKLCHGVGRQGRGRAVGEPIPHLAACESGKSHNMIHVYNIHDIHDMYNMHVYLTYLHNILNIHNINKTYITKTTWYIVYMAYMIYMTCITCIMCFYNKKQLMAEI